MTQGEAIVLAPHNPEWAAAYASEAASIVRALSNLPIELEHIGSTAIPGIVAKPVIDMLGAVPSVEKLDAHSDRLTTLGYEALGEFGIAGRRYFRKNAANGVRTHHYTDGKTAFVRAVDLRALAWAARKRLQLTRGVREGTDCLHRFSNDSGNGRAR
ncbi:MAG TPA: GrpB family protein [Gemmatimonadaceae bacterium]|nr:GrpB family protein [Gemmatimonadaceae bacterium]